VSTLAVRVAGTAAVWSERSTLMESSPEAPVFRVEVEDDGSAAVVFGDGTFGRRPPDGAQITADYRFGGGSVGNVGANTLVVARPRAGESTAWLVSVTNPLPASGGRDPETSDHARRFGPATLGALVAVTPGDYQDAANAYTDAAGRDAVQRSTASFQWTGSWLSVTLAVDPAGAESLPADLRDGLLSYLDTRRLAGYDLDVVAPRYVPIDLALIIRLASGARPGDVEAALLQTFGTAALTGGRLGFFHPDRFTFGDPLPVGQILAAAQGVPGVASVELQRLSRLRSGRPDLETAINFRQGFLAVGPDEIVRLDNDPNAPENGVFRLTVQGVAQ
jgi:predicted phage baseplate assembly protein